MPIVLDSPESISIRIRKTRKAVGISQRKLAMVSGVSQSTIARIEKDIQRLDPNYSTIFNIVETLSRFEREGSPDFMGKKAEDIMKRAVVAVRPGDSVRKAISIMKDYDFPQLPVIENGRSVGTISQKGLFGIVLNGPKAASKMRIRDILEMAMPQVDANTEVSKLKQVLENFDAALVVKRGRVAGIITIYDILKFV